MALCCTSKIQWGSYRANRSVRICWKFIAYHVIDCEYCELAYFLGFPQTKPCVVYFDLRVGVPIHRWWSMNLARDVLSTTRSWPGSSLVPNNIQTRLDRPTNQICTLCFVMLPLSASINLDDSPWFHWFSMILDDSRVWTTNFETPESPSRLLLRSMIPILSFWKSHNRLIIIEVLLIYHYVYILYMILYIYNIICIWLYVYIYIHIIYIYQSSILNNQKDNISSFNVIHVYERKKEQSA